MSPVSCVGERNHRFLAVEKFALSSWCERQESNLHTVKIEGLKPSASTVPPRSQDSFQRLHALVLV